MSDRVVTTARAAIVAAHTTLSLEGLLKPIIDGLGPLLGDDPSASLEFTPNDERVEWLRIARQPNLPCAVILAAGSIGPYTAPDARRSTWDLRRLEPMVRVEDPGLRSAID